MSPDLELLFDILKVRRPAHSASEEWFVDNFIFSLPNAYKDGFGNVIVDVGHQPKIIFSCHTDTAERDSGCRERTIKYINDCIYSDGSSILGADDGAGIWMLIQMINSGVNGRYIFHRCEEIGAVGANYIVANHPELLVGINTAIAFDRRGTSDLISEMFIGETCSQEFVDLLAEDLTGFKSATGSFTDIMFYSDLIDNCCNVSVGYYNEHSYSEYLDVGFLFKLRDKVISMDWGKFYG